MQLFIPLNRFSRLSLSLLLAGICRLLAIPASSNESDNLLNLLSGMNNCMFMVQVFLTLHHNDCKVRKTCTINMQLFIPLNRFSRLSLSLLLAGICRLFCCG
jgi:hypothetical protein